MMAKKKKDIKGSTIHWASKSVVWRMFSGQTISQELFERVYIMSKSAPYQRYMLIFVVLSNHVHLVKIYIFYFLLMIIVEKLGYTS
jgi:hypothetical protein